MTKTIFISGGAQGIGRALVELFIAEGWNVASVDKIPSAHMETIKLKRCFSIKAL